MSEPREVPETETPETGETSPGNSVDPKDMSLEDLEKILDGRKPVPELDAEVAEEAEEPAEEPEPEAEPEEAQEPAEEEAADADSPVEEEPAETVEAAGDDEPEITLQDVWTRLQIAEERNLLLDKKLGRRAGNEGFLKQENERLKRENEQLRAGPRPEPDGDYVADEVREPAPPAPTPRQDDPDRAYLLSIAVNNTANGFYSRHPDLAVKGEDGQVTVDPEYIKELSQFQNSPDVQKILLAGSVTEAVSVLEGLMGEAHSKYKIKKLQATAKERTAKRVDQADGLRKKKRLASVSSSGGGRATPKKKSLDPMTMPMKDLEKIIKSGRVPS